MLRPYKFQIVAICQEVDNEGRVTAEKNALGPNNQPFEVFGADGLHKFADEFEVGLALASADTAPVPLNRAERRARTRKAAAG